MVYISSFEYDFVNEYLRWKGLDLCEVCGDVIEKNRNVQKYCQQCAKKIFREQVKNNMKKHRASKK